MLLLSNDLSSALSSTTPRFSILVGDKTLSLYLGEWSTKLRDQGFLNIVLWDGDRALGLGVVELESLHKKITFQERMSNLNSSEIVGLSKCGEKVFLQHWEGFRTEVDASSMEVIGQQFTK